MGVYDLLGQIDVAWITDPNIQKMVGAVAEKFKRKRIGKLPDVINTLRHPVCHAFKRYSYCESEGDCINPTVWTPEL